MTCTISFLPVGNADSIVIQTDDSMIVVDLGNLSVLEEWIEQHQIAKIDRIYLTHDHQDHCPKLTKLIDFINDCKSSIKIEKVHFPYLYIYAAQQKAISAQDQSKVAPLRLALKRIREWKLNHSSIVANGEIYSEKKLKIEALHPEQNYVETHLAVKNGRSLNEISIVLRVIYDKFSAILLADIEGDGLTELLQLQTSFTANIVKIPHHGAWPAHGNELESLLELIDPEIAILSVGSKNPHGHVKPELFDALINLKNDSSKRLSQFICTEVTRTCKYSDCSAMDKKGLSSTEKCVGEITIIAEESGKWTYKIETNHSALVANLPYAACQ